MYTSLTCLAVACSLSLSALPEPVWHRSYQQAVEAAQKQNRPVAVFVTKGSVSVEQILVEGKLSPEIRKVLANQYACVVLDRSKADDLKLIETFGITKDAGIVLSDRTASMQAYHHDGKIGQEELSRQLWQFADPALVVKTTVTNIPAPIQRISYYGGGIVTEGLMNATGIRPVMAAPTQNC